MIGLFLTAVVIHCGAELARAVLTGDYSKYDDAPKQTAQPQAHSWNGYTYEYDGKTYTYNNGQWTTD